jgi:hypothetical protein
MGGFNCFIADGGAGAVVDSAANMKSTTSFISIEVPLSVLAIRPRDSAGDQSRSKQKGFARL